MIYFILTIFLLILSTKIFYICLDSTENIIMLLIPLFSIIFCLSFINYQVSLVYNGTIEFDLDEYFF